LYGGGFGSSRVQAMYFCLPFEAINANKKTNDIFKHFQNWPSTINYVVDPKSILSLMPLDVVDKYNYFLSFLIVFIIIQTIYELFCYARMYSLVVILA